MSNINLKKDKKILRKMTNSLNVSLEMLFEKKTNNLIKQIKSIVCVM